MFSASKRLIRFIASCLSFLFLLAPSSSFAIDDHFEPTLFLEENGQALITSLFPYIWLENGCVALASQVQAFAWQEDYDPHLLLCKWTMGTKLFAVTHDYPETMLNKTHLVHLSQRNGICSLNKEDGRINFYQNGKESILGKIEDVNFSDYSTTIVNLLFDGRYFYILRRSNSNDMKLDILCYDTKTHTSSTRLDTGIARIALFRKQGELLAYKDGAIYPLITETMELGTPLVTGLVKATPDFPDVTPFEYSTENSTLYYVSSGNVFQMKDNQLPEMIFVGDRMDDCGEYGWHDSDRYYDADYLSRTSVSNLLPLPDNRIMIKENGFLYFIDAKPLEERVLELHGSYPLNPYSDTIHAHYKLSHPHVRRVFCTAADQPEYPLDITVLSTYSTRSTKVQKADLLDLSGSKPIAELYNSCFPQLQNELGMDGVPYAVPTYINMYLWAYAATHWGKSGLPDPPKTMAEFYEQNTMWEKKDKKDSSIVSYYGRFGGYSIIGWRRYNLLMALSIQYAMENAKVGKPINFDTPEYREILDNVAHLVDQYDMSDIPLISLTYLQSCDIIDIQEKSVDRYPAFKPLIPPALWEDSMPVIGAGFSSLCIPASSQNAELALDYLSHYADFQNAFYPINLFMFTGGDENAVLHLLHSSSLQQEKTFWLPFETIEIDSLPQDHHGRSKVEKNTMSFYSEVIPLLLFHPIPTLIHSAFASDPPTIDYEWAEGVEPIDIIPALNEIAK